MRSSLWNPGLALLGLALVSGCMDWGGVTEGKCEDGNEGCELQLLVNAAQIDFPGVMLGKQRESRWTIKNGSKFAIRWQGQEVTGDGADFRLEEDSSAPCGGGLDAGGECAFQVVFRPTAIGPRAAQFNLQYGGGNRVSLAVIGGGAGLLALERDTSSGQGTLRIDGVEVCGKDCNRVEVPVHQSTVIEAKSQPGSQFEGWRGGVCDGPARFCTWEPGKPLELVAKFKTVTQKLAFVSSKTYPPNLGAAAKYDIECNRLAAEAGLVNDGDNLFVAWMAESKADAKSRVGLTTGGFVRLDGRPFMDRLDYEQIYDGLSIDENGVDVGAAEVMTGARHMGFAKPYDDMALGTCGDWKLDSGDNLLVGSTAGGPIVWSYDTARDCKTKARIYCLMLNSTETVEAPKDTGKVIYLSSTYFKPGQGTPDAVCAATKPAGVAGSVKALLSTPTDAASRWVNPDARYVRPDGQLVGSGRDILEGRLQSGIWVDGGKVYTSWPTWTGSADIHSVGTLQSTCNNYQSATGLGIAGESSRPWDWKWWKGALVGWPCDAIGLIYCIEQ